MKTFTFILKYHGVYFNIMTFMCLLKKIMFFFSIIRFFYRELRHWCVCVCVCVCDFVEFLTFLIKAYFPHKNLVELTNLFHSLPFKIYSCPRGVMVKAMNCGIVVREFVLQSRYYVHFRANTLGKGMNPLILPPAMGK